MNIRFLIVAFFLTTVASLEVCAEPKKLTVGFIAPLSGPAQAFGEAARNGFELALAEQQSNLVDVRYEDDQFTPSKTITAFQKLLQERELDVVVCVGSATCNAIAPIAERRQMPLIGFASDPQVSKGREYVIRSYPSGQKEGARAAQEAIQKGFSNIAVLTSIHDYSLSWREGLIAELPPSLLAMDEQIAPDLLDFKTILLKAKQKSVGSFFICLTPGQSGLFAKQARQANVERKIGGCFFLEDKNESRLANGALNGAWYVSSFLSPDFLTKYEAKYHNQNAVATAAVHYDLAKIFTSIANKELEGDLVKHVMSSELVGGAAGPMRIVKEHGDQFFEYALGSQEIPR